MQRKYGKLSDVNTEEWRPVRSFEGWYEVSNLARVRRIRPAKGTVVGTIIKQTESTRGRRQVTLSKEGKQRTLPIHVLVAHAFIGPKPACTEINHIDYDHTNNLPSNLEYVTQIENIQHSYRHGHALTAVRGSHSPHAKLTEADVMAIRQSPLSRAKIAALYGVAAVTIKFVRTRRSWRHI